MTKFDILEELTAEFRLKQLLWDSLEEWDSLQDGWRQVRCTYHIVHKSLNTIQYYVWTFGPVIDSSMYTFPRAHSSNWT